MKINIFQNHEISSRKLADYIVYYVNKKPNSLICLAGGDTPLNTFEYVEETYKEEKVEFSNCKFVSLDEWVGLGKEVKGSCIQTLYDNLYNKVNVKDENICFFDGLAKELDEECKVVDKFIFDNGGIDIIILGIGMNGHLGFNEPGVEVDKYCSVVPLNTITKTVGAKYFTQEVILTAGITIGIKHILEARNIILMANGEKKADIVKKTVEGKISNEIPSTLVRNSGNSQIYLDTDAASKLEIKK